MADEEEEWRNALDGDSFPAWLRQAAVAIPAVPQPKAGDTVPGRFSGSTRPVSYTESFINHLVGLPPAMLKGGFNTMANWLDWKPEVGPDTLAPLGAGAVVSAIRPGRVPHRHFDMTPADRIRGSGNDYGPVEVSYMPHEEGVYLAGIQTDPAKRGRGYGRAALEQFLEEADAARKPVDLRVVGPNARDDVWLREFYRSLGFDEVGSGTRMQRPAMPPAGTATLYTDQSRASLPGLMANAVEQPGRGPAPIRFQPGGPEERFILENYERMNRQVMAERLGYSQRVLDREIQSVLLRNGIDPRGRGERTAATQDAYRQRRDRVEAMWRKGMSAGDIAELEGVTPTRVRMIANQLRDEGADIPRRSSPNPRDLIEQVLDLTREGLAAADVARQLGITRNKALGIVYRARQKGLFASPSASIPGVIVGDGLAEPRVNPYVNKLADDWS